MQRSLTVRSEDRKAKQDFKLKCVEKTVQGIEEQCSMFLVTGNIQGELSAAFAQLLAANQECVGEIRN
jgi:hypothetical protein